MKELGSLLKEARESKGVNLSEASLDLSIKEVILENIEEGNLGSFKDIYVLKDYIRSYSKYLGLDPDATIDDFNEYLFEYTSRIPLKEIEKKVMEQNSSKEENKICSPYTKPMKKYPRKYYILLYAIIVLILLIIVFWSVRQITVKTQVTNVISYVK